MMGNLVSYIWIVLCRIMSDGPQGFGRQHTQKHSETLPKHLPLPSEPPKHNRPTAATLSGTTTARVEERWGGRLERGGRVIGSLDGAQVREAGRFEKLQTLEGFSVSASGTPGLYYINSQPGFFCSATFSVLSAQISASPVVGQEN